MSEFHYSDMQDIIRKHNGGLALSTSCVNAGLMVRPRRAYLLFCRKPTEQDFVNVYQDYLRVVRANALKTKEVREKLATIEAEKIDLARPKTMLDETYCINYLKERGYKIMKPIAQYEEI